jgi:hypothetical protein
METKVEICFVKLIERFCSLLPSGRDIPATRMTIVVFEVFRQVLHSWLCEVRELGCIAQSFLQLLARS